MYDNRFDIADVSSKVWRFMRDDKSIIADRVTLRSDGIIEGHSNPNEARWAVYQDTIVFVDEKGTISTTFNMINVEQTADNPSSVRLEGRFRASSHRHVLQERSLAESAGHDPSAVDRSIELIRAVPDHLMRDTRYLEHMLIPALGLNNEILDEQPRELAPYFGKGLFLWQYPNQFAKYLAWLAENAQDVERFAEIGCRWGGTFIVVCEWLKRVSPKLSAVLAIDPIVPSTFMQRYIDLRRGSDLTVSYLQDFSNSPSCQAAFATFRPDMVFVDGDHALPGALADHLMARETADIIVHHDVASQSCPETMLLWRGLKQMETVFRHAEFVDQYDSVRGNFLGLGCLKRLAP